MVDREARDKMAEALIAYMQDELESKELECVIHSTQSSSKDSAIKHMGDEICELCDQWESHKIICDKETWDFFNRILLLLESDFEFEVIKKRRWHFDQIFGLASISLLIFCFISDIPEWFIYFSIPGIILTWYFHFQRRKLDQTCEGEGRYRFPFQSFSYLRAVYSKVGKFRKLRYNKEFGERKLHNSFLKNLLMMYNSVGILFILVILFPIYASCLVFPRTEYVKRVVVLEDKIDS